MASDSASLAAAPVRPDAPLDGGRPAPPYGADGHRHKEHVVRSAQLAMALLVAVAVAATAATRFDRLSAARLVALAAAGLGYVAWTLYATREATQFVLWHHRTGPARAWPSP